MFRIIFSLILLFIEPKTPLFLTIYILCGLSDVLDGYIARKYALTSQLGATLDSVADFIFISVVLVRFIPIINLQIEILIWIFLIMCVRLFSLIIGFFKYHTFAFLHTYANKVSGLLLFSFPILFNRFSITTICYFICIVASFSAIEELVINIKSRKLFRDIKGIFDKSQE